jgi:histidyl-tRNA synthetase
MVLRALPGFRDFYPSELAERAHIFAAWRTVARRFGFREYDGPPLEPLELYTAKSGDEIVGQLYNFEDKGGREVALRPEMTPTFARMVAARANALPKPIRWFSIPQLFRYERQQRGRLREHFQLNVDIVGEADVSADAELLAVAIEVVRVLGLTAADVRARVSDRRLLQAVLRAIGVEDAQMPAVFAAADKIAREPRATAEERLRAAGIADGAIGAVFDALATTDLESLRASYGEHAAVGEAIDRLATYVTYLHALGVGDFVQLDLSIVRGLAYYTGIVFELFDAQGSMRAICGGGRYDALLSALGDVDLPALGFGMGDVVLGEMLRERGLLAGTEIGLDYWVAGTDEVPIARVMCVASELRRRGLKVEYALRPQKLGNQLKAAGRADALKVCILQADGGAVVKRLSDGTEQAVDVDAFLDHAEALHDPVRHARVVDPHDPWMFDDEERAEPRMIDG